MPVILRPTHIAGLWRDHGGGGAAVPNADRTPARYRLQQREHLARNPAAVDPYVVSTPIDAYIGAGAWRVRCRCGEAPHADPAWGLSCCFGCGAIYEAIVFPADADAIEALLVKRPIPSTRNWQPPETLADLRAEQIAHGDPV